MSQGNPSLETTLRSLEMVSSRMIEGVMRNSHLVAQSNPEIQLLFQEWLACLEQNLLDNIDFSNNLNIREEAEKLGISESACITLLVALQRRGTLEITHVTLSLPNEKSRECSCFR